jgi:hypothetical protein
MSSDDGHMLRYVVGRTAFPNLKLQMQVSSYLNVCNYAEGLKLTLFSRKGFLKGKAILP